MPLIMVIDECYQALEKMKAELMAQKKAKVSLREPLSRNVFASSLERAGGSDYDYKFHADSKLQG